MSRACNLASVVVAIGTQLHGMTSIMLASSPLVTDCLDYNKPTLFIFALSFLYMEFEEWVVV